MGIASSVDFDVLDALAEDPHLLFKDLDWVAKRDLVGEALAAAPERSSVRRVIFIAGSPTPDITVQLITEYGVPKQRAANAPWRLRQVPAVQGALVAMDPHTGRDFWYVHDFFPGTRETDLARFPSSGMILDWMVTCEQPEQQTLDAPKKSLAVHALYD